MLDLPTGPRPGPPLRVVCGVVCGVWCLASGVRSLAGSTPPGRPQRALSGHDCRLYLSCADRTLDSGLWTQDVWSGRMTIASMDRCPERRAKAYDVYPAAPSFVRGIPLRVQ